jgi:hypothetical protein
MGTSHAMAVEGSARRLRTWLGVLLLAVGLSGHLLAARAIGGYYVAYRDHVAGFCIILVVTGAVVAALGWRYWKGRYDVMLLVIGAIQAVIGAIIYANRFNIH